MLLPKFWIGLGRAMQEQRSDTRFFQPPDGGICMNFVHRAHEIADIYVIGPIACGEAAMHRLHVLRDGPVGGQATQAGLPCVEVPIDKARQNDLLRRVDNLRVNLDTSGYRYDTIVLYKNIRPSYLAD